MSQFFLLWFSLSALVKYIFRLNRQNFSFKKWIILVFFITHPGQNVRKK